MPRGGWDPISNMYRLLTLVLGLAMGAYGDDKRVIGYLANWTPTKIDQLPFDKLTHINYAFGLMIPRNPEYDFRDLKSIYIEADQKKKMQKLITAAKDKTKTLFSIGGWTGSRTFSTMVSHPSSRKEFIDDALMYLDPEQGYGFDGLDIDWEYPGKTNGPACNEKSPHDSDNYLTLLQELRKEMDAKFPAEHKLLTAAVRVTPFDGIDGKPTDNVEEFAKVFDFVNIMAYDIMGAWSNNTGPLAPIYAQEESQTGDKYKEEQLSLSQAVRDWTAAGFPASKLSAGLALYGRITEGKATLSGFGQPIKNVAPKGDKLNKLFRNPYCDEGEVYEGVYRYKFLRKDILKKAFDQPEPGFTRVFDSKTRTPYLIDHEKNHLISYEDLESTREKVKFIKDNELGGAMVWDLSMDYNYEILDALQEVRKLETESVASSPPSQGEHEAPRKETPAPQVTCGATLLSKDGELFLTGPCTGTQYACANKEVSGIFNECLQGVWVQKRCPDSSVCTHTSSSITCAKSALSALPYSTSPYNSNGHAKEVGTDVEAETEPEQAAQLKQKSANPSQDWIGTPCTGSNFHCIDSLASSAQIQCNGQVWISRDCDPNQVCNATPTGTICIHPPKILAKVRDDDIIKQGQCNDGQNSICVNNRNSASYNQCNHFHWSQSECGAGTVCQNKEDGIFCAHPDSADTQENKNLINNSNLPGTCTSESVCFDANNDLRFSHCSNGAWFTKSCPEACQQATPTLAVCGRKPVVHSNPKAPSGNCPTSGKYQCHEEKKAKGYSVCDNNVWVHRVCAEGTVCTKSGDEIICDHANKYQN